MLEVMAEGGEEQGEALRVRHAAQHAAARGEGVGRLRHVGHVRPAVVRVGRHPPPDLGDEVPDGPPAQAHPAVELQLPIRHHFDAPGSKTGRRALYRCEELQAYIFEIAVDIAERIEVKRIKYTIDPLT